MTIPRETADLVRELLGDVEHREIARRLGISRGTVASIAAGRWVPAKSRKSGKSVGAIGERCDGCGGMFFLPGGKQPCRACRTRESVAQRMAPRPYIERQPIVFGGGK